jgi:ATP-binding cassette subfamily B (MDR/TAP) protein 6
LSCLSFSSFIYLFDGLAFVIYAVINKYWPQHTGIEINALVGLVAFAGLAALGSWKEVNGVDVWLLKRVKISVFLSLGLDAAQLTLYGTSMPKDRLPHPYPFPHDIQTLLHFTLPILRILLLVILFFALINPVVTYTTVTSADDVREDQPTATSLLLSTQEYVNPISGLGLTVRRTYGALDDTTNSPVQRAPSLEPPDHVASKIQSTPKEKEVDTDPTWSEILRRISHITPYLWPKKDRSLQLFALLCVLILILGRFVNIAVPFLLANLIFIFEEGVTSPPWLYLSGYVGLRFLQSGGGLSALVEFLWTPVMQYSDSEMSLLSFNHLLHLSFAWHTKRKTGEVLRILDRGAAINNTLRLLLFDVVPTFLDIFVALVVFAIKLDWTLTLVIFVVLSAYIVVSVLLTRWRTRLRRAMNERDTITRGIHTDCLLNYETVKYFNGEEYEGQRYRESIKNYQTLEYQVISAMNLLNLVQNLIITVGLLVGSMIVAQRIVNNQLDPSYFVFFIAYFAQLYSPLNMLGSMYRSINRSLVDAEKLLELLNEPTDINDKPGAPDLVVSDGEIEFDNVSFTYDGRQPALRGVSFRVPKGGSVALVGESGAGKSTILRLLYRFYDLKDNEGRILVDGQDIRDVTQVSLRRAIGVVPQDAVLFNSSLAYNIGYAKFGASREEVEEAAKAAQMHDRVMSFPDKYETKVGERGIRLSGGEKQRVAIARTLLKNPPILLLDEATSALDTSTERDIQKALQNLVRGRSSLSIAHRLSTIANADLILVLKDGQIIEQGNHKQLLKLNGVFAGMWADQISAAGGLPVDGGLGEAVGGYQIDDAIPLTEEPVTADIDAAPTQDTAEPQTEAPEAPVKDIAPAQDTALERTRPQDTLSPNRSAAAAVAGTQVDDAPATYLSPALGGPVGDTTPSKANPVAFPTSDSVPVAFPSSTSDETASQKAPSTTQTPGITFAQEVSTPERTGTPDPDSETKRKRISSQNFQRLARRISVTTRRAGSVSGIPILGNFRRDSTSASASTPGQESTTDSDAGPKVSSESPAPSISEPDKAKKEKEKKKKRFL